MVRLVDQKGDNFLYRGPMPKASDGTFARTALISTFGQLPKEYQLVLISCLTHERQDETEFLRKLTYQQDPPRKVCIDVGDWVYFWQVRAHTVAKSALMLENQRFEGHFLDFPGLIELIVELMGRDEPTVIYLHCRHGLNRTGAVTMAYLMRMHNFSLENAYLRNLTFHPAHKPTHIYNPHELVEFLKLYENQHL